VQAAAAHGVQILAILQTVPGWAASPADPDLAAAKPVPVHFTLPKSYARWGDYVRTVATRYKGKIHSYELWNEPETEPEFNQNPGNLTRLNQIAYAALKSVDPSIEVVSSALSSGDPNPDRPRRQLDTFQQAGALQQSDIWGYHFYASPMRGTPGPELPEALLDRIAEIRSAMHKNGRQDQLWSTETGWFLLNDDWNPTGGPSFLGRPLTPDEGAAFLARTYVLGWASGLSRIYWYAWRGYYFGITESNGEPKAPEIAFETIQRWLVGSTLTTCDRQRDASWICKLHQPEGRQAIILWNERGPVTMSVDPAWHVHRMQSLNGSSNSVSGSVTVSISPLLLEQ
jgi:hypothetical protein